MNEKPTKRLQLDTFHPVTGQPPHEMGAKLPHDLDTLWAWDPDCFLFVAVFVFVRKNRRCSPDLHEKFINHLQNFDR